MDRETGWEWIIWFRRLYESFLLFRASFLLLSTTSPRPLVLAASALSLCVCVCRVHFIAPKRRQFLLLLLLHLISHFFYHFMSFFLSPFLFRVPAFGCLDVCLLFRVFLLLYVVDEKELTLATLPYCTD